jgi:hypothetical protein
LQFSIKKEESRGWKKLENDFKLDPINLLATCCKFKVYEERNGKYCLKPHMQFYGTKMNDSSFRNGQIKRMKNVKGRKR